MRWSSYKADNPMRPDQTIRELPGFVLVMVLAMLALISLLVVTVQVNTRAITQEFGNLNSRADRYLVVNSALALVTAKIMARDEENPILEGQFSASYGNRQVTGTFKNLAGKVDITQQNLNLMQAVFRTIGYPDDEAEELAINIVDWGDPDNQIYPGTGGAENSGIGLPDFPDRPIQSLLELGQIPGFTQELIAQIRPYVTIFSGLNAVHPELVAPRILGHVPGLNAQDPAGARTLQQANEYNELVQAVIDRNSVDGGALERAVISGRSVESKAWEIEMTVSRQNRSNRTVSETFVVVIGIFGETDNRLYRILDLAGPLERIG